MKQYERESIVEDTQLKWHEPSLWNCHCFRRRLESSCSLALKDGARFIFIVYQGVSFFGATRKLPSGVHRPIDRSWSKRQTTQQPPEISLVASSLHTKIRSIPGSIMFAFGLDSDDTHELAMVNAWIAVPWMRFNRRNSFRHDTSSPQRCGAAAHEQSLA